MYGTSADLDSCGSASLRGSHYRLRIEKIIRSEDTSII